MAIMKTANTRRYAGRIEKPSALPSRPKSGGANVEPTYAPAICMPMIAPELSALLSGLGFDLSIGYSADEPYHYALMDKKISGDKISMVIPDSIGRCRLQKISLSELREFVELGLSEE